MQKQIILKDLKTKLGDRWQAFNKLHRLILSLDPKYEILWYKL